MKKNIVLIGMPGSGKSTIGVLLAKAINYQFIDGDLLIQRQEKKTLVDIINEKGIDAFLAIENQVLREINTEASVIATGGSAIFSEEAMKHLGEQGLIVYLDVSCEEIIRRVNNISTRGIAMKPGKTLADLYEEKEVAKNAVRLAELEKQEPQVREELKKKMMVIPNIIDPTVPIGKDDSENVELERFGEPVVPDFEVPYHTDIMEKLNGIDLDSARKVAGNGFYYLMGDIARLHSAVISYARDFMIDRHRYPCCTSL